MWEAAFATDELMQTADRGREAVMMVIMMVMLMMAGDGDDGSPAYFHHYKMPPWWEYVIRETVKNDLFGGKVPNVGGWGGQNPKLLVKFREGLKKS